MLLPKEILNYSELYALVKGQTFLFIVLNECYHMIYSTNAFEQMLLNNGLCTVKSVDTRGQNFTFLYLSTMTQPSYWLNAFIPYVLYLIY